MFFNNCIEKNQNKTHFEEGMHDEVPLIEVNLFLGTGHATKSDEFSEWFQTAVDPHPHPSEWSLSLELMCMHFILSDHHTSLHRCKHIYHKKIAT